MNLNVLTTPMMINMTGVWIGDPDFRTALQNIGALGVGILDNLEKVHEPLTTLQNNRAELVVELRELIDECSRCDIRHDSKARSVYYHGRGLIEGEDDEAKVIEHRAMLDLMFPIGLAVTKLPYIEESGAAIALARAIKPPIRAKLEAIQVGSHRLIDLVDEWLDAGHTLGRLMQRRADLAGASAQDGSNGEWIDVKAGRNQWIRVVRGLLWMLDLEPSLATVRERVVTALQRAIATAQRRSSLAEGELIEDEGESEDDQALDEAAANVDVEDEEFGVDTVTDPLADA